MNPLLAQFLFEARECLQGIAEKLLQLEHEPGSAPTMNELFRLVHTLKGNSGLFEFPEMTRVLHAGEDLLDAVRDNRVQYSQDLADRLLDAMDFVSVLVDEIEANSQISAQHGQTGVRLAELLRQLLPTASKSAATTNEATTVDFSTTTVALGVNDLGDLKRLIAIPEEQRMAIYRTAATTRLLLLEYTPEEECFFKGEDPFYQARQIRELLWSTVDSRESWPPALELDAYRCMLRFSVLTVATQEALLELFRYTPEQIRITPLPPIVLALPKGERAQARSVEEKVITEALALLERDALASLQGLVKAQLAAISPNLWEASVLRWLLLVLEVEPNNHQAMHTLIVCLRTLKEPDWLNVTETGATEAQPNEPQAVVSGGIKASLLLPQECEAIRELLLAQRDILSQADNVSWLAGRLAAVAATLAAITVTVGGEDSLPALQEALVQAQTIGKAAPLLSWLDHHQPGIVIDGGTAVTAASITGTVATLVSEGDLDIPPIAEADLASTGTPVGDSETKFGRRAEDTYITPKTLKVDQDKIDRLMALIGEMVVAKNSLPYLASRAETQYGVRELSREIKTQYAVINRIAEEMQDAIMQVRMMPVSFIFQRFPRLVRDTSRKLNKEVTLILEGEDTEIDKNIVEALADPLIHIVRNSLDHGIESPEVRRAAGKPASGRLTIRASQAADRVFIEIADDGKGIDPLVVKQKAYEKGVIDEATMERLTAQEAINLVFAAGFSTAETISDLSGRGVGMDVVRNAIEKVNGSVYLESSLGKGTTIRLSLPLSMAVTNVMIVEFDRQIFGVPMDIVVETVRVPHQAINTIKRQQTAVLRGRIVPLLSLNKLLALEAKPRLNEEGEFAILVVRINEEHVGILVDDFRETVDIILKPMSGILGGLRGYSGSALLGDGSVLMVLNPRELI